jgi:hypothetical protein
MKICLALLAIVAIITGGCQSDIRETYTAPQLYANVQGSPPYEPVTNAPPVKFWASGY